MVTTDPARATPTFFGTPGEVAPDVFMHPMFVNTYAVRTPEGLLLIDPGLTHLATSVRESVRAWSDQPVRTAVYTHGHADHAFGLRPFLQAGDRPAIIAQERCLDRFQRYRLMHGHNAAINQRQFSLPIPTFVQEFDWPTLVVRDRLVHRMGDLDVVCTAAKGETDDALWVWLPQRRQLFTGDLVIWQAPNCGNPQKVQRYPEEWADVLETMAGLDAEWMFPGHGLVVHGRDAIRTMLAESARYLRVLIDAGARTHERRTDAGGDLPRRRARSRSWRSAPGCARPTTTRSSSCATCCASGAGGGTATRPTSCPRRGARRRRRSRSSRAALPALVARGRALLDGGDARMAAHVAEWATRAAPDDRAAQTLKRDVYERRMEEEPSLMGRGIYRAAMNDARLLGEPPAPGADGLMSFTAARRRNA